MADGRTPELAGPQGRASQLGNMRKTLEDLYKAADESLNAARAAHDRAEASRMNQAQSSRAARASYDAELAIHAVMASAARDAQQQFQAAITAAVRARKGAEAQADAALRAKFEAERAAAKHEGRVRALEEKLAMGAQARAVDYRESAARTLAAAEAALVRLVAEFEQYQAPLLAQRAALEQLEMELIALRKLHAHAEAAVDEARAERDYWIAELQRAVAERNFWAMEAATAAYEICMITKTLADLAMQLAAVQVGPVVGWIVAACIAILITVKLYELYVVATRLARATNHSLAAHERVAHAEMQRNTWVSREAERSEAARSARSAEEAKRNQVGGAKQSLASLEAARDAKHSEVVAQETVVAVATSISMATVYEQECRIALHEAQAMKDAETASAAYARRQAVDLAAAVAAHDVQANSARDSYVGAVHQELSTDASLRGEAHNNRKASVVLEEANRLEAEMRTRKEHHSTLLQIVGIAASSVATIAVIGERVSAELANLDVKTVNELVARWHEAEVHGVLKAELQPAIERFVARCTELLPRELHGEVLPLLNKFKEGRAPTFEDVQRVANGLLLPYLSKIVDSIFMRAERNDASVDAAMGPIALPLLLKLLFLSAVKGGGVVSCSNVTDAVCTALLPHELRAPFAAVMRGEAISVAEKIALGAWFANSVPAGLEFIKQVVESALGGRLAESVSTANTGLQAALLAEAPQLFGFLRFVGEQKQAAPQPQVRAGPQPLQKAKAAAQ